MVKNSYTNRKVKTRWFFFIFFPPGICHHSCFHQVFIGFPCPSMSELGQSLPGRHKQRDQTGRTSSRKSCLDQQSARKNYSEYSELQSKAQNPEPMAIDLLFTGPIPLAFWKDVRWKDHWNSVCGQQEHHGYKQSTGTVSHGVMGSSGIISKYPGHDDVLKVLRMTAPQHDPGNRTWPFSPRLCNKTSSHS